MSSPGRHEAPIVNQCFQKKHQSKMSKRAVYWAGLNFILASVMYSEISNNSFGVYFQVSHPIIKVTEYILAVVFSLNVVVDLLRYLWPLLTGTLVEITPDQQRLLGIKKTDPGFRVSPLKPPTTGSPSNNLIFNTSGLSNHSGMSSRSGSPSPGRVTPPGYQSYSPYSPYGYSPQSSTQNLQSMSFQRNTSGYSPSMVNAYGERIDGSGNQSLLRSRHSSPVQRSPVQRSPGTVSPSDRITNVEGLNSFMREQDEKMYRSKLSSMENSTNSNSSFWNYSRSVSDYSHVLRKYQYQVASRSPQSLSSRSPDDPDVGIPFYAMEVFGRFGISEDNLTVWIENLRRWICVTVVSRLVTEINDINKTLSRIGCEDMQIGEVSVSTLKRLALTKAQYVPSLNTVVPYLDTASNQEYIVHRIKHLSRGGCMSDYDWNGGGNYGKPWSQHLPNDASLIVHMLCTYLDSRLPADPKYPDGKTFTTQYFLKTPEKPNLSKSDNLLLYQTKENPPHFNVVIGEDIWSLPKGRNNLFYAILLFLYHVKTKEHGMLGRINLGLSGVNVLWILDNYKELHVS